MIADPLKPVKPAMRVDIYSHHFTVYDFDDYVKHTLLQYCRGLGHYGLKMIAPRQFVRAITTVYAARTSDSREFRFHINGKGEFDYFMASHAFAADRIETRVIPLYEPVKVIYEHLRAPPLRPYQVPQVEYLTADGRTKVLTLPTGYGKGITSMSGCVTIGDRVGLVIKGMYVDKWIDELKEVLGLRTKDILLVRGSKDLHALIALAKAGGIEAKWIIITGKTMYNYFQAYEEATSIDAFEYECLPEDFWKLLGVGIRVIDEVHQEFHANFRLDLYSHVPKTISMSATLDHDDNFINRMYRMMFPPEERPPVIEIDKYIDIMALQYRILDLKKVRYFGASKMYSQIKFEQSILRYKDILQRYVNMIAEITRDQFVDIFEPGQRMLIFCGTVEMCNAVKERLHRMFPDLAIGRYTQEDDFSVLEMNDLIVTTLKSAGTAVDISGLRVVLMTDNIDSKQANVQAVGRLRKLKNWPDVSPMFIYIYAGNIDKHVWYSNNKKDKLRGKVKSFKDLITQYHV
jgi:superfamily II DNA or RNA helicase